MSPADPIRWSCNWHGYDVVRANESRRRNDIREVRAEIVTSEAVVRCRRGNPLFGPPDAPLPAAAPDAGARTAPLPPPPSPPAPPAPPTFYPDAGTPSPDRGSAGRRAADARLNVSARGRR